MRRATAAALVLATVGASCLVACTVGPDRTPELRPAGGPVATARPAPAASRVVKVTLLYTSDEHGWLLPFTEDGVTWGGAAAVLGMWIAKEGHCPGPAPADVAAPPRPPACGDPATIAISGGDNFTGPAISTFFAGTSMAVALRRMGYSASTFGNHEFDFGREQFVKNRDTAGLPYLAANVDVLDPALAATRTVKYVVVERRGVRIAFVGIATDTTPTTAMPTRFTGYAFKGEEAAIDGAVREAWATHPDAVIAVAHECPDVLVPLLARHPEWNLAFFGAGHCHKVMARQVGGVWLMSPGWRLMHYIRVPLEIDPSKPERQRVLSARPELVETARQAGDQLYAPDHALAAAAVDFKNKMEAALGEEIGFTKTGFAKDSREIAQWIATAWREEMKTDVAVLNLGGIRQAIPKGPITKATVWSVMPFDNKLVVLRLKGKDLVTDLQAAEMAAAGLTATSTGYVMSDGRKLDPERTYTVTTIDFLYLGGEKALFRQQDPDAKDTNLDWRTPLIAWTKRVAATGAPIESRLPHGGVHNP